MRAPVINGTPKEYMCLVTGPQNMIHWVGFHILSAGVNDDKNNRASRSSLSSSSEEEKAVCCWTPENGLLLVEALSLMLASSGRASKKNQMNWKKTQPQKRARTLMYWCSSSKLTRVTPTLPQAKPFSKSSIVRRNVVDVKIAPFSLVRTDHPQKNQNERKLLEWGKNSGRRALIEGRRLCKGAGSWFEACQAYNTFLRTTLPMSQKLDVDS